MAWELREHEGGSWSWEVFQSAYGFCQGHEGTLAAAATAMVVAEAELLDEPMPATIRDWFLNHADRHLQAVRFGLIEEIERHVFPLDRADFEESLRAL